MMSPEEVLIVFFVVVLFGVMFMTIKIFLNAVANMGYDRNG
jgi:hypothetical protein